MREKHPATVFGRRLRQARERIGIPQDRLGVEIGLDEGSASARISRYETGTHEPPFEVAEKLAEALNIPTVFLYCTDDDLAAVLLAWAALSKAGKKQLRTMAESIAAAKAGKA